MKNSDLPKKQIDDDKLNIAPFASRVAQGVLNYKQDESFVISIKGEWGIGKTICKKRYQR